MIQKSITIVLLFLSLSLFGQEKQKVIFLQTDSTWTHETFQFPLSFAEDIKYKGMEEAVFPAGWGKQDSSEFWSYVFVWNIKHTEEITEKELEKDLQIYFNGLMRKENTLALVVKNEEENRVSKYVGKIKTYDNFFTKMPMTLNVLIEEENCAAENKSIILFRFSPKGFGHAVWDKLGKVKTRGEICDL